MSDTKSPSRFPVPELDDLPEDLRERILAEQEKAGFIPEEIGRASCRERV